MTEPTREDLLRWQLTFPHVCAGWRCAICRVGPCARMAVDAPTFHDECVRTYARLWQVVEDMRLFAVILTRLGYSRRQIATMNYATRLADVVYWTEVLESQASA